MQNSVFDFLSMNKVYVPFPRPPEELATGVRGLASANGPGMLAAQGEPSGYGQDSTLPQGS
jgi:hypothetical protein